ncbi:MAG TPA: peptidoglycan bridge formation protein FemAB, partial [Telluria sp.]|nr:peptidoglycan bridge formation protein FemAB [Telluria sp.]
MSSIIEAAQARRAAPAVASAPQTLHLLQPQDYARWDAFVRSCPDATFFHLSGWQKVIEQSFGNKTWFYYVEQDGQIQGVLPLSEIKSRLFGHSLGAMPFCVYGGVAAIDANARVLLDGAADKLARELGVGHLEYRGMER